MEIKENESLKNKTTMKIGGVARYFAEPESKEDVEEAYKFAQENNLPLIALGAGSNTIFADGTIEALVVRIKASSVTLSSSKDVSKDDTITIESGKNLAQLINELADQGLALSPLTGIPGTVGGAVVGNAGQGPNGKWIDSFVESVTVFESGKWKTLSKEDCEFGYRESVFKKLTAFAKATAVKKVKSEKLKVFIVWSVELVVPKRDSEEIKSDIEQMLQKRIADQPHVLTSGSCFKASADGTPAWKLIDKAGLRNLKIGGVHISEKHANFLINEENGGFKDVCKIIETVKSKAPDVGEVEMRLVGEDGKMIF